MAIDKQKLILISGIFLGIMAIVMAKMYIDQQKQAVQEKAKAAIANLQTNQTAVIVAKQDIPQGSMINPDMFETSIVPNKFVQPQAVTSLDRIAGMITVAPISKGEQISLSKLARDKSVGKGGGLAGVTPSGKRAIAIVVDNLASLSGMVRPGDYVDVLAIMQVPMNQNGKVVGEPAVVPLFQNVLVLAVGQDTGAPTATGGRYTEASGGGGGGGGNSLITLALSPNEANLIAFVQEQGKMRLIMRSPADGKMEPMSPVSWESLFQYIAPPAPPQSNEPAAPAPDTTEYVEVLRGLNKEQVPLSK